MRFSILAASCFALAVAAQNMNCGPKYGNRKCDAGQCCEFCSRIALVAELAWTDHL